MHCKAEEVSTGSLDMPGWSYVVAAGTPDGSYMTATALWTGGAPARGGLGVRLQLARQSILGTGAPSLLLSVGVHSPRIVEDGRTFSYLVHEADGVRLRITQNDVRAIQLAKAALRAGIELLMQHAGLSELTDIRLAGAFGSHIDPVYALVLGLVPDCPVEHVRSVGNAAGAGAVRALLSVAARREMEAAVRGVVKIETATEPDFQSQFVAAMAFPHASAPSTHLSGVIALPERTSSGGDRTGRRRRARGDKEES